MPITLRLTKGSELTYAELDGNFTHINNQISNLPDSGQVSAIILNDVDSAYVNARLDTTSFLDSAEAIALIDAAHVQARQDYAYASLTGKPNILDSADVSLIHDAAMPNVLDSANISAIILDDVDAAYVQARETPQDFAYASLTGAPTNVSQFTNDAGYLTAAATVDSAEVEAIIGTKLLAVDQNIIPDLDSTYSLGSPTHKWKDLYLSGNTLHLGQVIMSVDDIGLQMNQPLQAEIRMTGNLDLQDGIITSTTGDIQIIPKTTFPFGNNKTQFLHVAGDAGFMPNLTLHGTDVFFGDSPGFTNFGLNNIYMHVGRINTLGSPLSNNDGFKAAIVYHEDDAKFKLKDSDGWFDLNREGASGSYNDLTNKPDLGRTQLTVYTVATLPTGGTEGELIYVQDGDAGSPCLAVLDGLGDYKVVSTLGSTVDDTSGGGFS